ncbi:MAG: glycosyltransferase family 4 protein [Acidimicrobiales bacterium]|nr:glycosyltransferase family 4 protein [Acidimicrobiales bacterium]
MPRCSIISFRFGPTDGVSVVARNWADALHQMGFDVDWVAGGFEPGWHADGAMTVVPGLGIDDNDPPDPSELDEALAGANLVVVENLCTIPLNPAAAHAVGDVLRGRPTVLHHHDPPWQRERFAHVTDLPPDDPAWRHVTINDLTRRQMADRGIAATTIHNGFDPDPPPGDRVGTRAGLGVDDDTLLVAHPVRAIPRKDVGRAIKIAAELGGTYWLLGPAEDGYGPELERLLADGLCPVLREPATTRSDVYAAADLVVFPSTWEGFGNPPVEATLARRPAVVGDYPVADELRALGLEWFPADDLGPVRAWLADPDPALLDRNREVAARELSLDRMAGRLRALLDEAGWLT